ncbi:MULTISPECIES: hypothetical protein [Croceibacter]|uniref:hypothetical protein n=1 Tax=Croceibacter TaxID=216431 RepID=UPI002352D5DB|nr:MULTISPECIES: hypothetical protein [Croceibacter]|tara:strand:+ start:469 stop:843 length:375 start_codon:yes stop_codon:yes gene_type:complete
MKQDSLIGTKKMKKLMTDNGFTFYKANEYPKRNGIDKTLNILYKEEVTVDIYFNDYNNIESIAIRTGNDSVINELKKIAGFEKWKYHSDNEYELNGYKCQYVYRPDRRDEPDGKHIVHQFLNYY